MFLDFLVACFFFAVCLIPALIVNNQFATCPITGKRDFKQNMYDYFFFHPGVAAGGHRTWYSKEGYEKRFNCVIKKCDVNKKGWRAYPIPKSRPKGKK